MPSKTQPDSGTPDSGTVVLDVRNLTPADLGRLGMEQMAYVKPVIVNGTHAFAIHAADGTPMAVAQDHGVAVAAILQHEMIPAHVH